LFSYMKRGRAFYKNMVWLAIPIILQNLITSSLALADTFMIGLLGEEQLAGVTLANIPIYVVQLLIFGFQSGSSVLISQHWGKGDTDSINRIMGIGFYVAGGVTALFGAILFFFPAQFMSLFGNDPAVVAIAARYAKIVGFSYFFDSFVQIYIAGFRSMENPRLGLYILSLSMVTNTFLNWVLIFGKLGAPAMGVEGGALATLIARAIGLSVMLIHATCNRRFRLQPTLCLRPGQALIKKFIHYASPVVLNETLWGLGTGLYPTVMGHMEGSKEILAAFAIAGNIEKVCTVAIFAVAGTAAIITGREIGAGRKDTIREVGATLNTVAVLTGIVVGIVMLGLTKVFFVPVLYPLFKLSDTAASISTMMLVMIFLVSPLRAFNCTNIVGVLRGGGDVRMAALLDLLPLWLFALPLTVAAGLIFRLDIFWVYLATHMENFPKCIWGILRVRSGKWIHDVTLPASGQTE